MNIILFLLAILIDGLLNTNLSILVCIIYTNNIFKHSLTYYVLLSLIGLLIDIIFTETILLNTVLFPLIGYITTRIYSKYKESIIVNILTMIIILFVYKFSTILILTLLKDTNYISINVIKTLTLSVLRNIPFIIILNINLIISYIKNIIKSKIPKKLYLLSYKENLLYNYKTFLLIFIILIISVFLFSKETATVFNDNEIKLELSTYYKTNKSRLISSEVIDTTIYLNLALPEKEYIIYEVSVNNNTDSIIKLDNIEKNNITYQIEINELNENIIIPPKTNKIFYIKVKYIDQEKQEMIKLTFNFINL